MLKITGIKSKQEIRLLKQFTQFVLGRFLSNDQIRNSRILIEFITPNDITDPKQAKEFRECSAWMSSDGISYGKPTYTITMNRACTNSKTKVLETKYKNIMKYLAHELVHVKQYALGEMVDVPSGGCMWKGQLYPDDKVMAADRTIYKWEYFEAPWELEAYGRMEGLYAMFVTKDN